MANKELRDARMAAHASFDRLWRAKMRRDGVGKSRARGMAYAWLARMLGLEPGACHIGYFGVDQCRRVVEVCAPYLVKQATSGRAPTRGATTRCALGKTK
jgi:hypothetical protein